MRNSFSTGSTATTTPSPGAVEANVRRVRDLALGYPQMSIGVLANGRWLLRPPNDALAAAALRREAASDRFFRTLDAGTLRWRVARAERGLLPLAVDGLDLAREAAAVADYFEAGAADNRQAIVVAGQATVRGDRSLARAKPSSTDCSRPRIAAASRAIAAAGLPSRSPRPS